MPVIHRMRTCRAPYYVGLNVLEKRFLISMCIQMMFPDHFKTLFVFQTKGSENIERIRKKTALGRCFKFEL